jgi:hypothetical protein
MWEMTLPWTRMGLAALAVAAAAGCAKTPPKTPVVTPVSLNVPAPPPRHVIPVSLEPIDPPPAVVEPPPATTTAKPPAAPPPPKPPDRTTPPPTTPPPANTEATPPVLQTTRNVAELETKARRDLARAKADLQRVRVATLGPDARDAYNNAGRFIILAEESLQNKNFVAAEQHAEKAAILASGLVKSGSM